MSTKNPITIARGDGIGPEIMDATLGILEAAGAQLEYQEIEIGEAVYKRGVTNGIEESSWESLHNTGVLLKAPITTPYGGGFKSLNVTIRKTLGLFANVRPCYAYMPYVKSNFPGMDLVIVRENEEDLYGGIEHRQTQQVVQTLKLISRPGSEKICRFAFEYAKANNRKKVTCMVKDNIMKLADGLFYKTFEEISKDYPEIEAEHFIIDIGAARIAARPLDFDVIVTENLYGDIVSDIAAEVTGSVGLGGSANIGANHAMFEAIHGSAPDIAGQGIANPSGLILGAVQMLVHLGQGEAASKMHNAWFKTLEDGIHTGDIYREDISKTKVGTQDFAKAVIERLGEKPAEFKPADYPAEGGRLVLPPLKEQKPQKKELVGVDVFLESPGIKPDDLGEELLKCLPDGMSLVVISNRGVKVWPEGQPGTFCTDHWRTRFMVNEGQEFDYSGVINLLNIINTHGLEIIKTENLYNFDGEPGYSLAQGQ